MIPTSRPPANKSTTIAPKEIVAPVRTRVLVGGFVVTVPVEGEVWFDKVELAELGPAAAGK